MTTIATAQQLRDRFARRAIVAIPDTPGFQIEVRAVDLLQLILTGQLQPATIAWAMKHFVTPAGESVKLPSLADLLASNPDAAADLIDSLVCASALAPRITREPVAADAAVLQVNELPLIAKLEVFVRAVELSLGQQLTAGSDAVAAPVPAE